VKPRFDDMGMKNATVKRRLKLGAGLEKTRESEYVGRHRGRMKLAIEKQCLSVIPI